MKTAEHPTALRIQQALSTHGVTTTVVEFEQPTRTSAEAAAAIGCTAAEIAKSVVFRGMDSGLAVIAVASGENRVSESKVAAVVGESLGRADARFVREATGFVIGGVAPLGHVAPVKLVLDADLQRHGWLWAAGGTPHAVFRISPADLARVTGAGWSEVRQDDV